MGRVEGDITPQTVKWSSTFHGHTVRLQCQVSNMLWNDFSLFLCLDTITDCFTFSCWDGLLFYMCCKVRRVFTRWLQSKHLLNNCDTLKKLLKLRWRKSNYLVLSVTSNYSRVAHTTFEIKILLMYFKSIPVKSKTIFKSSNEVVNKNALNISHNICFLWVI